MVDRNEFEKGLALNIGLMAKKLQEAGYSFSDLDTICDEALVLIQNSAEQITVNDPLQTQNIENLAIMVLMHGAITSQKKFINDRAKDLKTSVSAVENIMIKDTIGK